MALQHFLLLRAAVGVAVAVLSFIYQPVTAQTLYNSEHHNLRNWQFEAAPSLAAFASYKDMNDYVANRHLRGLRKLDNPSDDSYIQAFNQHNEQSTQNSDNQRQKRNNEDRKLPNQPKLLMFEISDAVEPSDAVKALIKKHRSLELSGALKTAAPTVATPTKDTPISSHNTFKMIKISKPKVRTKRMAPQQRMPANFKVQMIPFDVSDAKESGAEHKEIVKRMRSMELVTRTKRTTTEVPAVSAKATMNNWKSTRLPNVRSSRAEELKRQITHKRARRSAPQMIKFELEDAKEPDASMKMLLQQKQSAMRENKAMKLETPLKSVQHNVTDMMDSDNENPTDQSSHESKRYFVYQEAPLKVKKSVNSLPYEVQKVVTHLMKDNQGAKAYVKYLPAQKNDYNHFRSYPYSGVKYVQPSFGTKLQPTASFVKYYLPAQQKEQLQVQIHPVPVVEKVRYVYTPVAVDDGAQQTHAQAAYVTHQHYAAVPSVAQKHHTAAISQPIVVQDASHAGTVEHQATQIHHTYTADLSNVHQEEVGAHEAAAHSAHELAQHEIAQAPVHHVASKEFRASKPDPIFDENKITDTGVADHHAAAHDYAGGEHYKYAVYPKAAHAYNSAYGKAHLQLLEHQQHAAEAPLIKIEYHAPPDPAKENYKELAEFKQLSHLMGKSPEDQIHGLTYLLAKEMQSKLQLQRQHKKLEGEALLLQHQRPQDSTAPILFHPTSKDGEAVKSAENIAEQGQFGAQPGHLIGMAKTKQYIPIVESKGLDATTNEKSHATQFSVGVEHVAVKSQPEKVPAPTSFVTYGLSPNYERGAKTYQYARPQTHYATLSHHAAAPSVGGHQGLHTAGHHAVAAAEEHQHVVANGVEKQPHAGSGGVKLDQSLHIGSQLDGEHALQYASKYAFGYRIRDFHTGNDFGHKQNRDLDGVTRGQYHILLPDGRIQNVIYHADDTGFHADVSFETGH